MFQMTPEATFFHLLSQNRPELEATINGNTDYPDLHGAARFFETPGNGILVELEVFGLPDESNTPSSQDIPTKTPVFYGIHLHEIGNCTIPFDRTGNHYNPRGYLHPQHAGDFPPLLSNNGYAYMVFYNSHLSLDDIYNRSVVIHSRPDDFFTQPSGNSGDKIGCGVIRKVVKVL